VSWQRQEYYSGDEFYGKCSMQKYFTESTAETHEMGLKNKNHRYPETKKAR